MAKDINGAEITQTPAPTPAPHPLKAEWDACKSTDERLAVMAKALGIT